VRVIAVLLIAAPLIAVAAPVPSRSSPPASRAEKDAARATLVSLLGVRHDGALGSGRVREESATPPVERDVMEVRRKILKQDPRSCSHANRNEVGKFLAGIMRQGGTPDWRRVLRDATGEDLSTRAMVEYFRPLEQWLEKQNRGREIGWD